MATSILLLSIGSNAALATAGTLGTDSHLGTITCDNGQGNSINDLQIFGIDSTTLQMTNVGSGTGTTTVSNDCASEPAIDHVNNVGYTNLWGYASGQDTLASFSPETGAITAIGSFTLDGSDNQSVNSLLIANDGTLYALSHDSLYTATYDSNNGVAYVGDNSNVAIETLDLGTCGLTSVATGSDSQSLMLLALGAGFIGFVARKIAGRK